MAGHPGFTTKMAASVYLLRSMRFFRPNGYRLQSFWHENPSPTGR